MRKDPSPQTPYAPRRLALHLAAGICVVAAGAIFAGSVSAQTPATQTPSPGSVARPVHRHKRPSPGHPLVVPDPVAPAPLTTPAPQAPNWPAFDKAAEAAVVWDSHGLAIDAANSSLEQILKDVSTATGAKVEGLSADQRVFGAYGPGQARDVLSQLLQGSGYNVIMIGDQGQGAPRQILLSVRQAGLAQPAGRTNASGNEDDDAEEQQPAVQEPIISRPGFPVGAPRSPQQIMQEMQQRQQQVQQQQQLQQQQQPQQAPAPQPNYQPSNPPI